MEYVIPHRGSGRRSEYELLYDGRGREGQPTMCGLIDVKQLAASSITTSCSSGLKAASSGQTACSSGSDRPVIGAISEQVSKANVANLNGKPR